MNILISNADPRPIYEQIYSQIRNAIVSGEAPAESPLPSIRSLAKDLRISVITTKRAYDELERDGYINTVAGKGCFVVAVNAEVLREHNLCEIENHLAQIRELAKPLGISPEEIAEMYSVIIKE